MNSNFTETLSYCNWSLHRTKRLAGHKSTVISLEMCEDGESFISWDQDGLGIRWRIYAAHDFGAKIEEKYPMKLFLM